MMRRRALVCLLVCLPVRAQVFHDREILIPWAKAGQGLDALLVYADLPGKHPLAVLTHGTSRELKVRNEISPWAMLPQATWFARRGWVALVVARRGYGRSGGRPDYLNKDFMDAGREAAEDLTAAIGYASSLPEVDASHIIAAGVSTGGFATVALTEKPPAGLVAAFNFAGGRGSRADHDVPKADELIGAYRRFGKQSRTPMLWIYAENDKYFWPELARKFDDAFRAGGGQEQFVLAPAIGSDGHSLYGHVAAWSPIVDDFLKAQNLVWLPEPLPPPKTPDQPPPAGLSENGQRVFHAYLRCGPHKAFAMPDMPGRGFGVSCAQLTLDLAKQKAIESCKHSKEKGGKCKVVSIDGAGQGRPE